MATKNEDIRVKLDTLRGDLQLQDRAVDLAFSLLAVLAVGGSHHARRRLLRELDGVLS